MSVSLSNQYIFETNDPCTGEWSSFLMTTETYEGGTIDDSICDGVLYLKQNNAYYRRVLVNDKVNVKWFGALGNGLDDDFDFIQTAINHMPEHKTLYFPNGTYLTTDSLVIKSNITFLGENQYETFLNADVSTTYIFTTNVDHNITSTDDDAHLKNVHFAYLSFTKDGATHSAGSHLINIQSTSNLTITNCNFKVWSDYAICLGQSAYQIKVEDILIDSCNFDDDNNLSATAGIYFAEGENVQILKCSFSRINSSVLVGAIYLGANSTSSTLQNFEIKNNTFESIGGGNGAITMSIGYTYAEMTNKPVKFIIKDNIFNYCNITCKFRQPNSDLTNVNDFNIDITGNEINNNESFFIIDGIKGIVISNNTIYNQQQQSTVGYDYLVENISIEMNRFFNSTVNQYSTLHTLYNVRNYSIHSNTFKDSFYWIFVLGYTDQYTNSQGYVYNNVITNKNQTSNPAKSTNCLVHSAQSTNADADVRENIIPLLYCDEFQP